MHPHRMTDTETEVRLPLETSRLKPFNVKFYTDSPQALLEAYMVSFSVQLCGRCRKTTQNSSVRCKLMEPNTPPSTIGYQLDRVGRSWRLGRWVAVS